MEAFLTALETAVTPTALWGAVADAATLVGVLILFAFGYNILRKVIKGAGKGKPRI